MPADCNANGDIFGGWLMSQVDLAGCILPMRLSQGRMATVAVKEVFIHPAGARAICSRSHAKIERVGTTSVTVEVQVLAQRLATQNAVCASGARHPHRCWPLTTKAARARRHPQPRIEPTAGAARRFNAT